MPLLKNEGIWYNPNLSILIVTYEVFVNEISPEALNNPHTNQIRFYMPLTKAQHYDHLKEIAHIIALFFYHMTMCLEISLMQQL